MSQPPMSQPAAGNPVAKLLGPADIPAMLLLQAAIIRALPPDEQSFIVPKSESNYAALLNAPNCGIGFVVNGVLIAQMLLATVPPDAPQAVPTGPKPVRWPVSGLTDCPPAQALASGYKSFGVVQSVLVHPNWRRQGLMEAMLQNMQDIGHARGLCALLSEVATVNPASFKGFLRRGYEEAAYGIDPDDGTHLTFFALRLAPKGPHC